MNAEFDSTARLLLQASIALLAPLLASGCSEDEAAAPAPEPAGSTAVFASVSGGVNADRLAAMHWSDVAPTAEATLRHGLANEVRETAAGISAPPCQYLCGLLELAASKPDRALAVWNGIDLAEIPTDLLYAPWKVSRTAGVANRYKAPLAAAVKSGTVRSLVAARWHSTHGSYLEAVNAYLKTNPADWSPHEVQQFGVMKLYAPVAAEVDHLIAGALRGGQLPKPLRVDLARLLKEPTGPDKTAVADLLKSNPDLARTAVAAARRQFDLRQAFAANRFSEVCAFTAGLDPGESPAETVLLAFLAAARTGDRPSAEQWAEELLRQNPGRATNAWVSEILQNLP